jgi:signal transduction histidine kinase
LVILSTAFAISAADYNSAITLSVPDSPEELPYRLTTIIPSVKALMMIDIFEDINYDGIPEYFEIINEQMNSCEFNSRVVGFRDLILGNTKFTNQYNSPIKQCKIIHTDFIDIIGDSTKDLILTKRLADTLLLEIVEVDSACYIGPNHIIIKVGVGRSKHRPIVWGDVHVNPLLGIDLNSDGYKDLIYSRIAQPDSAIERGLVAYDIRHEKEIWFFPTADMTTRSLFALVTNPSRESCFVFGTISNANAYSASGMTSTASYLLAIDLKGKELWRRTIGGRGFTPNLLAYDINDDGIEEILASVAEDTSKAHPSIRVIGFNPFNGEINAQSDTLSGVSIIGLKGYIDISNQQKYIIAKVYRNPGYSLVKYNSLLKPIRLLNGVLPGNVAVGRLIDSSKVQIVSKFVEKTETMTGVFNDNFNLMAYAPGRGDPSIYYDTSSNNYIVNHEGNGYDVYSISKQPLLIMLYARYKWWMAVILSMVILGLLIYTTRAIIRLYNRATGMPGLDKINAFVLLLDNKGRIIYKNNYYLKNILLGKDVKRQLYYDSPISKYPEVIDCIKKSYLESHRPIEGIYNLAKDGSDLIVSITIYPNYNDQHKSKGKIIIIEDVTLKSGWERKAVIGEAAQRWIHRIKGNMSTVKIILENLEENDTTKKLIENNDEFKSNLINIKKQVSETAETSERILHFTTITKPEFSPYNPNKIIEAAISRYLASPPKNIIIEKDLDKNLPDINVDHLQLLEVFENLITNAIKAQKNGGKIIFRSELAKDLLNDKSMIKLSVEDFGCGILEEDKEKIFQAGFSKDVRSSGVGLAIVKEIIENHRGKIIVDSEFGKGSKFTIILPKE